MVSVCHFIITNKDDIDDLLIYYDKFISQIIILLKTNFIPKKSRSYFIKLFEKSCIEESKICIDNMFNWLYYFQNIEYKTFQ